MASIVSINPAKTSELVIKSGGDLYALSSTDGLLYKAGETTPLAKDSKAAKAIITEALAEIESKTGKLPQSVRKILPSELKHFVGLGANAKDVSALEKNFASVQTILNAAKAGAHNTIAKELIKNPAAQEFLGTDGILAVDKAGFDFDKLVNFNNAKETLKEIVKVETPDAKTIEAVKAHLIKNHEHLDYLEIDALNDFKAKLVTGGGHKFDFDALKTEITDGVAKSKGELKNVLTNIVDKADEIKRFEKAPGIKPEVLTKAKTALGELEKKYTEISKGEFSAAALKATDEALVNEAKKASPSIATSIESTLKSFESGAKNLAKEGGNFLKSLYTHTKPGENFGKVHNWKVAGLVGAGAVVAYAVAGTGKKGKAADMNAEQVQAQLAAQQGQQPEVAGAAR